MFLLPRMRCLRRFSVSTVIPIGVRVELDGVPVTLQAADLGNFAGYAAVFAGRSTPSSSSQRIVRIKDDVHHRFGASKTPAIPFRVFQSSLHRRGLRENFGLVLPRMGKPTAGGKNFV